MKIKWNWDIIICIKVESYDETQSRVGEDSADLREWRI